MLFGITGRMVGWIRCNLTNAPCGERGNVELLNSIKHKTQREGLLQAFRGRGQLSFSLLNRPGIPSRSKEEAALAPFLGGRKQLLNNDLKIILDNKRVTQYNLQSSEGIDVFGQQKGKMKQGNGVLSRARGVRAGSGFFVFRPACRQAGLGGPKTP